MPTLIRIFVALLVLAGIAFGGMLALAFFVDPGQKEIRVKIPSQQLGMQADAHDPLGIRDAPALPLDLTTTTAPVDEPPPEPGTKEVDIPE